MEIYNGLEIAAIMKPFDKAICYAGTYRNYVIEMSEWGDICWTNGQVVGLDRWYIYGKWKLL